ncbi:MAG TPA: hypothetical protein P5299_00985 [Candidatus Woesebacteria bacterium]|nr:hypothetical protein [Candidatus Woesebacteria bacterium]HRT39925.1 hypothetical protein [Candidatus Woesebacteria bacterium]
MEIQNLTSNPLSTAPIKKTPILSWPGLIIVIILGITSGFWLSRLKGNSTSLDNHSLLSSEKTTSVEEIGKIEVGKIYGSHDKVFKDNAIGVIEKGPLNGEGTHILNREGGLDQRAALTSSTVDLDLFVGKKVEVKGETNASNKAGWLLDVGTIKVLE